jgi:putative transposase
VAKNRHVKSPGVVRHCAEVYLANVSPKKLAKTPGMANFMHDAGWSMLRNMLSHKSIATGGVMRVVAERYRSQACSVCGCIPASSSGWVRVK